MGGDGLLGALAGELRHTDGVLAVLPGGRGNDFARKLGLGNDPVAACDVLALGREQRLDVADINGRAYLGIASSGLDSDAGDLANATRLRAKLGQLVYVYATLRAVRAWRPARWEVVIDGEPRSFNGYSVAVCNSGVFGGGMFLAPDAKLDDGMLDVVMIGDIPKRKYLASLPKVFTGAHVREPGVELVRAQRGRLPRRPAVQRAGRRRPDRRPAGHRARAAGRAAGAGPVSLLAPKVAAAKAVGALARRAGRGGGTSLPGKLLTRLEPHAIGMLAGRLEHGNIVISATNGKTTTAAMVASILERTGRRLVHNRAGANMAGGVASALADASRRGGRELDGDLGPVRGRRVLARRRGRGARPARDAARQPVPRPARPLRRARHDRRPLGRGGRRSAREHPARAQRRRPAGRRPRPGAEGAEPWYFGVEDDSVAHTELQHASDSKHCRRCGHAYVYDAAYMGHLGRYHCPNCGNRRPEPAVAAESVQLRGIRSAAFTLRAPGRLDPRRAAAARALQRLQRARRGRAVPVARRRAADHRRRPGRRRARLRARGDARARRPRDLDPAGQEPGRRQRGPAHARARGRRARPVRRPQRPHRRRPRRLLGVGRRLGDARAARQAHDLLGHARRRARAADEVRRRADRSADGRRGPRRPGSTTRSRVARARSTPSPPTPRCWSCAACSRERGAAKEYWR